MTEIDGQKVLGAYSMLLQSGIDTINDIEKLPYPKNIIKAVLLHSIKISQDKKLRDLLEGLYVMLASFQPLSSAQKEALKDWNNAMFSKTSEKDQIIKNMKIIANSGEVINSIEKIIVDETSALRNELLKS